MKKILIVASFILIFLVGCNVTTKTKNLVFEMKELSIQITDSGTLPLKMENITISEVEFTLSNSELIALEGLYILPLKIGTTTLTATLKTNPTIKDSIVIHVTPILPDARIPQTIEVDSSSRLTILNLGKNEDFNWVVADESIVSIDSSYVLYAKKVGKTTITVTNKSDANVTITYEIEVLELKPVLFVHNQLLEVGDVVSLELLNIINKTNDDYTWELSDSTLAEITNDYRLKTLKQGNLTIKATSKTDSRVFNEIDVIIGKAVITNGEVTSGQLFLKAENPSALVKAGETIVVSIVGGKDNYNYRWLSSDPTIVAVTDQGVVHGIKEGQSVVTVFNKQNESVRGFITITVHGTPNVDYVERLITAAFSEEGYREEYNGGNKFGDWFLYNYADWCAMFVSWSANQAGIGSDVIHKYSLVSDGVRWFTERDQYHARAGYTPKRGDIIFFVSGGRPSHVGIVVTVDTNRVYTIEGNTSNSVAQRSYLLTDTYILGYGAPAYPEYNPN